MNQMGGHAIFMDPQHSQISKTKLRYETTSISGYCDFILARLKNHDNLLEMVDAAKVPSMAVARLSSLPNLFMDPQ